MLKYAVRLHLHTHFPAECAAVKHQFDKTMVQSWSVMRGKGYTPGGFWSGNAQWCGPLLNVEFVSRLLRVQANDWTGHEGEVATVVGSCMLGARLFQHASDQILKGAVGKFIDETFQNLVSEEDPPHSQKQESKLPRMRSWQNMGRRLVLRLTGSSSLVSMTPLRMRCLSQLTVCGRSFRSDWLFS